MRKNPSLLRSISPVAVPPQFTRGYGLTFGLHTRVGGRAERVARLLRVGNIYVNRNIIGAVVGSQPFTLGFRLAGVRRIFETSTEDDLERAVAQARKDPDVAILILETKDVSRLSPRTKSELVSSVKPTLVAVGLDEDNTLREKIKQAVGVDLW